MIFRYKNNAEIEHDYFLILKLLRYIYLMPALLILQSCYTLQHADNSKTIPLTAAKDLQGYYSNTDTGYVRKRNTYDYNGGLWQVLHFMKTRYGKVDTAATIELKPINEKRVQLYIYRNHVKKDSMLLKGKVKGGYYVLRNKSSGIGIPIILFAYKSIKVQMAKSAEGGLHVYARTSNYGSFFLFSAGSTANNAYYFKQRDNK